jgi:hypothetical protein
MKILFYRHAYDPGFESIISAIRQTKNTFGYLSGDINQKVIIDFSPDIIMHNIPEADKFPVNSNAISININETDSKHSFSLTNQNANNYIKPFVTLKNTEVNNTDIKKFTSDVVYIGSPSVFGNVLDFITNPENDILFKFFTHQVHNINGYCGMCDANDYLRFYKHSKASLVRSDDTRRIMDIVIADGSPIVFDGINHQECIEKIKDAIANNKKYSVDGYSKQDIISKHTSYDRASQIFKTIGLNKIAENILKHKGWEQT